MMLLKSFQQTSRWRPSPTVLSALAERNHAPLTLDHQYSFSTFARRNPVIPPHFLQADNDHRNRIHLNQRRDITIKTILFSGGLIYLVKKFVGIKLIQWYGWKRIYRLNHRRSRDMMRDLPEEKRAKSRKMMTMYSKMARTSYDFFVRHPKFIENWLLIDRVVTNTLLFIPRKVKLSLHRWLASQLKLQRERNKSNPVINYAKRWQGPLTLGIHEMVGFANVIILSQYILMTIPEKRTLLDAVFVITNQSDIQSLNEQIQLKWRNNPQELERKEYVNLLKMKMN